MATNLEALSRDSAIISDAELLDKLSNLVGEVSEFALQRIKSNVLKLKTDHGKEMRKETCKCKDFWNYRIPCIHILPLEGRIPLSMVSERWHLSPQGNAVGKLLIFRNLYFCSPG